MPPPASPRPWLLVHGSADDVVPLDARELADAANGSVEMRAVPNGAHRLRHDPRHRRAPRHGWTVRIPERASARTAPSVSSSVYSGS
jgi:pimeloyl-ACP methyl ester carboxylesterase